MKKFLSLVMALVLLVCCTLAVPFSASAAVHPADYGDVKGYEDTGAKKNKLVFYPAELENSEETYPVIVWANGTMCPPALYMKLFKDFVREGFIVVASSEIMSADGKEQSACVDYILDKAADENSVFYNKVDAQKIVAMGHSQGGRSTVNAAAADSRFCCAVSIAGSNFTYEAKKLSAPTLFLTGTADLVVASPLWVKPAYEAAKGPAAYASLKCAVHTTCTINTAPYVKYASLWIRAWADHDENAMKVFSKGGAMAQDRDWQDFVCKNLS